MHPILTQYDGVIFDMDGTLVDSMPSHLQAWQATAQQFNFPYDATWHHSLGGVPSRETVHYINERYQLSLDPNTVSAFKKQTWETLTKPPVFFEQSKQLFDSLLGKKKLAVGTGSARKHAEMVLNRIGILSKLDGLVTACDVKQGKPAPDTFAQAAEALQLPPHRCVVFEDTEIGRQAAHAAGIDCILVTDGVIVWPK